ncbi:hypothetical protein BC834DRAFT_691905 [Gloeopeniophorella convolvens]|nr:hypothetical protein BC834DRAFT_691905 [Gloeopeniophorella convolvens]
MPATPRYSSQLLSARLTVRDPEASRCTAVDVRGHLMDCRPSAWDRQTPHSAKPLRNRLSAAGQQRQTAVQRTPRGGTPRARRYCCLAPRVRAGNLRRFSGSVLNMRASCGRRARRSLSRWARHVLARLPLPRAYALSYALYAGCASRLRPPGAQLIYLLHPGCFRSHSRYDRLSSPHRTIPRKMGSNYF